MPLNSLLIRPLTICAVLSMLIGLGSSSAVAQEIRTWSDASGRFKIEAKFVSQADGQVKLVRADGKSVEIDVKKLSEADQKYLQDLENDPFKVKDDGNPFMPAKESPAGKSGSTPAIPSNVPVDWSLSKLLNLEDFGDGWEFSATEGELDFVPKTVELPKRVEFFEKMSNLAISPDGKRAAVGYLWTFATKDKQPRTRLVMCDLGTGKVSGEIQQNVEMSPLALHADGQRVLMKQSARNETGLEIWTIQGRNLQRNSSWNPHNEAWGGKGEIQWAAFAGPQNLLLKHGNGWVSIWDFERLQPVCHFQIEGGCTPALSADGKILAFYKGERIGLIDTETFEVVAMQKSPRRLNWPNFAFSPSQKRLACVAFNSLLVWDVETGELYRDFEPSGLMINGMPRFAHDDFILLGNRYLVELENMIKLWDYHGGEQVESVGGTTFFAVSPQNQAGALMPTLIPHEAAMTALNAALNEPDLFVFRQGAKVQLDLSGIPAGHQAEVEAGLRGKLQEMQIEIVPSAAVTVKASVSGPKQEQMNYSFSGTYTVQVYGTKLEFLFEGKSIWQSSGTNIPHFVHLKRGENLGDLLREKSKQADYSFYRNVTLPKFVQKPIAGQTQPGAASGQTIGSSQVVPTTGSRQLPRGRTR